MVIFPQCVEISPFLVLYSGLSDGTEKVLKIAVMIEETLLPVSVNGFFNLFLQNKIVLFKRKFLALLPLLEGIC